jgi:hypothetical protein
MLTSLSWISLPNDKVHWRGQERAVVTLDAQLLRPAQRETV